MFHQKILETVLNLHEYASTPMKRVFELCLEAMEDVSLDIESVSELPDIPFTKPIVTKIQAALGSSQQPENGVSSKRSQIRRRKKRPTSGSESNTSQADLSGQASRNKKRKKTVRGSHRTTLNGYIDQSDSSSTSSLPDISPRRVKCFYCNVWMEKHEMRKHKTSHHINDIDNLPSPTMTRSRSTRLHRQARFFVNQMEDFEYY